MFLLFVLVGCGFLLPEPQPSAPTCDLNVAYPDLGYALARVSEIKIVCGNVPDQLSFPACSGMPTTRVTPVLTGREGACEALHSQTEEINQWVEGVRPPVIAACRKSPECLSWGMMTTGFGGLPILH